MNTKKTIKYVLVILFVLLVVEISGIFRLNKEIILEIPFGTNSYGVSKILKNNKLIGSKIMFTVYSKLSNSNLQAGFHKFKNNSYFSLKKELCSPASKKEITITVTEGMEQREIADLLEKNGICTSEDFNECAKISNFNEYKFLNNLPKREYELEGYLFPDTYLFSVNEDPKTVIKKMLDNFESKTAAFDYFKQYNGLDFDKIITLASIVEREGANLNDYANIASVFYNRLSLVGESNGYLESCATVQYILKERKNVLSVEDTKIASDYNTYINSGLPIGPIASPGITTINAVMKPAKTRYLYFVSDKNGKILFAETFSEHRKNMEKVGI